MLEKIEYLVSLPITNLKLLFKYIVYLYLLSYYQNTYYIVCIIILNR